MKKVILLFVFLLTISQLFSSQSAQKINLSGYVKDQSNGEALIGVMIYVKELKTGVVTNNYGYYSLNVPPGSYSIDFIYLGYDSYSKKMNLVSDKELNVELLLVSKGLKEVVVHAERKDANVTRNAMSAQRIEIGAIRKIPALMGEVDLLKAIQLLPGVVSAGEGTSSFSVRGGAIDQNLIVLDEATVYNASHLMGFFSVFNNDAIKNITLYKGDVPVVYDGRLSSLLEVNMKDGNSKKFEGSGGIGSISSRLTLEGPINKEKTSFVVSARRTYADLFLKLSKDEKVSGNQLYFYDLNAKLNHKFNESNRLFISGYFGQDVFKNKDAGFDFGNSTLTARWNHLFSRSLFSNLTLSYSNYTYGLQSNMANESNFKWNYRMRDFAFKYDFTHFLSQGNILKYGCQATYHRLSPADLSSSGGSTENIHYTLPDNNSFEQGFYLQSENKLTDKFSIKGGLRLNAFSNVAPGTIYNYDSNYKAIDSTVYTGTRIVKTFFNLSPRIGVNYQLTKNSSLKANYSRTNQFLQMASNSTAGTPLDLWFTASPNVKPQTCDQYVVGYFHNFNDNKLEASVELFYKDMKNTIDFQDHASLLLNPKLEGELRFGKSNAYGAEFLFQKKEGQLTGWVSYCYSRSKRTIEGVNNGNAYPAPYDRPHTIYIVASYDLNKRITFGANFVYSTGQPITYPVARMEVGNVIVPVYSNRNEYRMPDYNRMDVSMTLKPENKKRRPWLGEWNFSIYNVYAHKNAWAINFVGDKDKPGVTKAEMTYLFTFIPSVTYNFKF